MKAFTVPSVIKREAWAFLQLAVPLASAQVAQAMTGFVDTVMMGWLGQESLAAGGLAAMIFTGFLMTGTGILSSVSSLVAEAYGAQRSRRVGQVTRHGLWISVLLAIPSLPIIANLDAVMLFLGQDPMVVQLADSYLQVVRWGLLPGLVFAVLRGMVTSLSQARPIMVIVVVANLLNMVGNYVLAFGKLGFPALGLAGLGLASVAAHTVMAGALLIYILWQRRIFAPYHLFHQWYRLHVPVVRSLFNVGLPIGISTILEHGLFTVMTFMMGTLGTHVLAAQQLALQTVLVAFMVPLAMSYAATIRVGQWYGQRDWCGVRRAARVSIGLTIAVMIVAGITFIVFPKPIISLYLDVSDPANQDVLQMGVALLTVAGFGQVVDGIQRTANGVLQGVQDTRVPMVLGMGAYWVIGLLTAYWLGFHTSLGGVGVWIGAYVGLMFTAIAYLWRFRVVVAARSVLPLATLKL